MNLKELIAIAALGLGGTHSAAAAVHTCAADPEAMRIAESFHGTWAGALERGNAQQLASLYGESAVLMPPGDLTVVGPRPIGEYLAADGRDTGTSRIELVACEKVGDSIHVAAVWGSPAADSTVADTWKSGNLMRVLERARDGGWRTTFEIWN